MNSGLEAFLGVADLLVDFVDVGEYLLVLMEIG